MSNYVSDTPYLGIPWCPTCQPDRDPTQEILETRYCDTHTPNLAGDVTPSPGDYLSGSSEAGGESNRIVCELIHGGHREA